MDTHYASVLLETAESTQDEAVARFTGSPLLVVAEHQVKGRGRFDRTWVEPDRGLFTSLAFVPAWPAVRRPLIPLVAGLAMRDALEEAVGLTVDLRWPNDLMFGGAKVGGILVESDEERTIVGCGVNLWWADPIEGAAGVLGEDPGPGAAEDLAALWAGHFLERMAADPDYWGHHEYESACLTVGRAVDYEHGTGTAVGIDSDGALLIDTGDSIVPIHAGEIRASATLPTPPFHGGAATEETS